MASSWVLLVLLIAGGEAADAGKPHINSGVNKPFPTAKPDVKLTGKEESMLASGSTVKRQVVADSGKGGRAMAVQDVRR